MKEGQKNNDSDRGAESPSLATGYSFFQIGL